MDRDRAIFTQVRQSVAGISKVRIIPYYSMADAVECQLITVYFKTEAQH